LSESMRPRKRYNGNIAAMRRTKNSGTVLTNKQEDGYYKGKEEHRKRSSPLCSGPKVYARTTSAWARSLRNSVEVSV
jgi:hypothetical protein